MSIQTSTVAWLALKRFLVECKGTSFSSDKGIFPLSEETELKPKRSPCTAFVKTQRSPCTAFVGSNFRQSRHRDTTL